MARPRLIRLRPLRLKPGERAVIAALGLIATAVAVGLIAVITLARAVSP